MALESTAIQALFVTQLIGWSGGLSLAISFSSVESQKGVNVVQTCSVENQKGAIAVQHLLR